ncbi:hypothetical protein WN51_07246 [Melipona quadrifasciata]|uniref:Uncharacterized protein n=1 Tax=Melipona quadrifasciata TaxID=166423 RepID=A0A0M8ZSK2_9HYME|nr:hypothetical protein WN51_07246 [Melipona quadrifasciata]
MIVTFTSLLVIVFILELSGGISGYVLRARASSIIQDKMKDSMQQYQNSSEISIVWDNLQRDVKFLFIFFKFLFLHKFYFSNECSNI